MVAAVKQATQNEIVAQDLLECDECPLNGPKVGTRGPRDAPLVIIGESPGVMELKNMKPFMGPSGKVLDTTLTKELTENAYIINALQCFPPKPAKKNPALMQSATRICSDRVEWLIKEHPRKLILTLGNNALWSVTGNYGYKITQARGFLIPSELSEFGILPALHPAALLRGTGSYRQFFEDMTYARELVTYGESAIKVAPEVTWQDIETRHEAKQAIRELQGHLELTCDLETAGFNCRTDRIVTIGITTGDNHSYNFLPKHLSLLKPLFESGLYKWCWHNGKFDVQFLRHVGIDARVDDDTMLMSYALDEKPGVHDLESVASDILGAPDYKDMLKPYLPKKDSSYADIPLPVLNEYMAIDVVNTGKIRPILSRRVHEDDKLATLYRDILVPASEMLSRVESNGFCVDLDWVDELDTEYSERVDALSWELQELAGVAFNPNSSQQVANILYHHLELPNRSKGSTAVDALKKLPKHPVVVKLLEYRKVKKAHSTYIKPIYKHCAYDGRVHATFLLHGTKTGRLASRNPNLQNIPRDKRLKGMFVAAPGYIIVEVDLSQAELRSLATLSGDERLVEIYVNGLDLHLEVEKYLFGTERNKENRVKSKNVNFGIVYGITGPGLAEQTGKTVRECSQWIEGWYERFPDAADFIKKCRGTVARGQVISTLFGRKKRVGIVTEGTAWGLQNEAANFPHQSIASDITLYTAIKVEPTLRSWGVRIVDLVHDSIITECPEDPELVERTARYLATEMQKTPIEWGLTTVPFVSDAEVGKRWGNLEEYAL